MANDLAARLLRALEASGADPALLCTTLEQGLRKETASPDSTLLEQKIEWSRFRRGLRHLIHNVSSFGELAMLRESDIRDNSNFRKPASKIIEEMLVGQGLGFREETVSFEAHAQELFGSSDQFPVAFFRIFPGVENLDDFWQTIGALREATEEDVLRFISVTPDGLTRVRRSLRIMRDYGVTGLPVIVVPSCNHM